MLIGGTVTQTSPVRALAKAVGQDIDGVITDSWSISNRFGMRISDEQLTSYIEFFSKSEDLPDVEYNSSASRINPVTVSAAKFTDPDVQYI